MSGVVKEEAKREDPSRKQKKEALLEWETG